MNLILFLGSSSSTRTIRNPDFRDASKDYPLKLIRKGRTRSRERREDTFDANRPINWSGSRNSLTSNSDPINSRLRRANKHHAMQYRKSSNLSFHKDWNTHRGDRRTLTQKSYSAGSNKQNSVLDTRY